MVECDNIQNKEQFGLWLGLVARLWRTEIDRQLAAFGLTESRWLTLFRLSRLTETVTQRELAEAVGVRGPTLVRTLDGLEAEGLIERRADAADRRTKTLHLGTGAAPILEQIESTIASICAEIFADITDADVATCLRVFELLASRLGGAQMVTPKMIPAADGSQIDE